MEESPEFVTRLSNRVDQLEQRVFRLEHPDTANVPVTASTEQMPQIEAQLSNEPSFPQSSTAFAVLGKAMLGMAGAYALRAVAESGSVPKLATVVLAIAYAGMWLVWATGSAPGQWFASAIYSGTSALILAPMLWELTLRFNFLSPSTAAALLGAFLLGAYILAWKRSVTSIVWIAHLTTAITAIALLAATHSIAPFIATLLLMAMLSEYAADRGRWGSVRPVAAVAADIAVWALLFIYSSPDSNHPEYGTLGTSALLAPACLLLLIYGASVIVRTALLRREITAFEAAQAIIAFLLAANAVIRFAPPIGVNLLAIFCLLSSAAGYLAIFLLFNEPGVRRNYQIYALWSAALFLFGCFLYLSPASLPTTLGAAAIISTSLAVRTGRLTLAFHGLAYMVAAAFACGCLQYTSHALVGVFPEAPSGMAWIISVAAVLCYLIGSQFSGIQWKPRLFHVLSAGLAVSVAASIMVSLMVWLTATVITPGASHVAVIRTLGACSLALMLALTGSRWQRTELVWTAYGTLALVTAKLLFEDLRQGHPEFIAASIFLYAVTLIMVPHVVRRSSRKPSAVEEPIAEPVAHPR
jgi:hypothetical protein